MALRSSPTNLFVKGENNKLREINKGEHNGLDSFLNDVLRIPKNTTVFHCNTSGILPPIEIIGGRETRLIGDTCRMFFKVKQEGRVADYFFWDGIVSEGIQILEEPNPNNDYGYFPSLGHEVHDIGLATGRSNYRMVLIEKQKRLPVSG